MPREFTPDPVAFFLTWTTHVSWLPGDARGWTDPAGVVRPPAPRLANWSRQHSPTTAVELSGDQRASVERTIAEHCAFRGWHLHAVACRTQHVHVVVTAPTEPPARVVARLKARCSRMLSERVSIQSDREHRDGGEHHAGKRWWTTGASMRRVYDMQGVIDVVTYVRECQDRER
jgi:REP element-mobilizing transposase RayT